MSVRRSPGQRSRPRRDDVTAWSHADDPAAARIAERLGFAAARRLWVMRRTAAPVEVPAVDGVTIRGYRDSDAPEVLRVNAAAFAHHPEQGSMDAANLAERMAEPWFDPAGLLVADAGDRLLGFHWTKRHSDRLGEVYVVAVDPAAQGRGLGRAAHRRRARPPGLGLGVRRVLLYVESDNAAAIATYSRLGLPAHPDPRAVRPPPSLRGHEWSRERSPTVAVSSDHS